MILCKLVLSNCFLLPDEFHVHIVPITYIHDGDGACLLANNHFFSPRKLHSPILIIIYSISHSIFLSLFPFSSTVHIRVIASMDTPVCSAKRIGMNATRIHARTVVHASTASHNTIAVVQMDLLVSIAASILFHLHMFVCDSV